jgi:Putative esterase
MFTFVSTTRTRLTTVFSIAAMIAPLAVLSARPALADGPRFEISFSKTAHPDPITGRVYVAISKPDGRGTPISSASETGSPLFAVNVVGLAPGATAVIDQTTFGAPVRSLRDIPAGDYMIQPFVNVYTKFDRADGHTVWLHMDQWEGQDWKRSPGNLFGDPVKVHFDPASSAPIVLVADKINPPVQAPADTDMVKRIKIQSQILTKWWGQPIYLGAVILLPKDYDKHPDVKYPVVYDEGHFSLGAPGGFGGRGRGGRGGGDAAPGGGFTGYWQANGTPRMIMVTLQHPSPYYDDSYGVNSENNGPYGDAIMKELIPAVETQFRVLREPWARLLTGGSTGGWISLAHQILYPDFYGGTWSLCPDAADFRHHQVVNIYDDANAYFVDRGWMKLDRVDRRQPDGNITTMMKDENWFELVEGDHSRSGGQWDIWEATYGPVGADGYPQRIWDKQTGAIDKKVAAYWKEHFDLRNILQTNWATLGPKVANKINVYVGDMDTYNLNMGVHKLNDFLVKADDPKWTGEIIFQPMAPHCWGPPITELIPKMAAQIDKYAPAGSDLKSWRY